MVKHSELGDRARFLFLGLYWESFEEMYHTDAIEVPEKALPENGGELSRKEIEMLSKDVHYTICAYDPKEYTYRSSGTLFDAFAYGTPVIALTNPLFEAYFEDFGDIGYLCESVEEVQKTVIDILKNPPAERYLRQQACLEQARCKLQISNLAEDFKNLTSVCDADAIKEKSFSEENVG